jgi:nicotinate phosphoribosyltransferase
MRARLFPEGGVVSRERLSSHVFDLPVQELRRGYRSDVYFWRSKVALERHDLHPNVTMQVFQKKNVVACGIDEAIAILKLASGFYTDYEKAYKLFDRWVEIKRERRAYFLEDRERYLEMTRQHLELSAELDALWETGFEGLDVDALYDGDEVEPWETVMHVTGDYSLFGHLETIFLGVLARRTRVATNVRRVVQAAGDKPILYFPARFDHWAVQGGDGYAAHVGGAKGVSTDAQGEWWGAKAGGTVPHALIAGLGGDTVRAVRVFGESYPDVNLVALVDFENDCVRTALECARALGGDLWGVRVDTSENLVDRSVIPRMGTFKPTGVVPELVFMVREALDREGFDGVKIIASGGFDADKISQFESQGVPVDAYGVGSALMAGSYDYTADVVRAEGSECAKVGRHFIPNPRLERVHP